MITPEFSKLYNSISISLAPKQGSLVNTGVPGLAQQHAIRDADTQASAGYVSPDAGAVRPPHTKE